MKEGQLITLRLASQMDLVELRHLEEIGFLTDRFSEDQIQYLLTRAHATVVVAEEGSRVVGAVYGLWHRRSKFGRLYNVVVDPEHRGKGIAGKLIHDFELEAARRGYSRVSLEVRTDNNVAIEFYRRNTYLVTATINDYYEDGCAALKMVKGINHSVPNQVRLRVPYYAQTLDFTCGPSCLMMALRYFKPDTEFDRALEMNIWKEATLVFMTSGIGGTGPFGLALSAIRRGLTARVISSTERTPFVKSVRDSSKREVIRIIHEDVKRTAMKSGAAVAAFDFGFDDIKSALYRHMIPIALISTYRLTGDRSPHWVVVTGFDQHHVYIHDPDETSYADAVRARNLKVTIEEFSRMSRYGKDVYRCVVLVGCSGNTQPVGGQ